MELLMAKLDFFQNLARSQRHARWILAFRSMTKWGVVVSVVEKDYQLLIYNIIEF